MTTTLSPLTKIICLSGVLSSGFLLIILSCALFHNYYPLYDIIFFLLAPLPNFLFGKSYSNSSDFMSDQLQGSEDFGNFITGLLVTCGISFPIVFYHSQMINYISCIMSILGGLIIYLSIVIFTWFFNNSWNDGDDGLFGY